VLTHTSKCRPRRAWTRKYCGTAKSRGHRYCATASGDLENTGYGLELGREGLDGYVVTKSISGV